MTIYKIFIYISEGDIKRVLRIIPTHWVYGRDFSIKKQELIPESALKIEDVSILVYKRDCKTDYLPWPHQLTIGNEKTDGLSFLIKIEPNKLPQELYNICKHFLFQISRVINDSFYICGKCQHNNGYCMGPCALCGGVVVLVGNRKKGEKNESKNR